MDECLNDDDDEEHHRGFFDCFGAPHTSLSVHAGSVHAKQRNRLPAEPVFSTAWPKPAHDHRIPAPAGTYGRSTGR